MAKPPPTQGMLAATQYLRGSGSMEERQIEKGGGTGGSNC